MGREPITSLSQVRLLRREEVAEIFGVDASSVWRASRDGLLPTPLRYGKATLRWLESDILDWINAARDRGGWDDSWGQRERTAPEGGEDGEEQPPLPVDGAS